MPTLVKHSVTIAGHRTSISLEDPFWQSVRDIANAKGLSVNRLIEEIDAERIAGTRSDQSSVPQSGLSSAIRVFVLHYYRTRALDMSAGK